MLYIENVRGTSYSNFVSTKKKKSLELILKLRISVKHAINYFRNLT